MAERVTTKLMDLEPPANLRPEAVNRFVGRMVVVPDTEQRGKVVRAWVEEEALMAEIEIAE